MNGSASERRALMLGLTAVLLWSTVASAFKIALRTASPTQLLAGATLSSTIAIGLVLVARGRLGLALSGLKKHAARSLKMGAINPLLYYLLLFEAYERLPAHVALALNYTWPLSLSILAWPLLGQRPQHQHWFAIAVAYLGVFSLGWTSTTSNASLDLPGVLLALSSAFVWSGYWLLQTRDDRPVDVALFQNFLPATLFTVLTTLLVDHDQARPDGWSALSIVYVGCFEMGFTFLMWQTALHSTERVSRLATLSFCAPILSVFWIVLLLSERPTVGAVVGFALVMAGVLIHNGNRSDDSHH